MRRVILSLFLALAIIRRGSTQTNQIPLPIQSKAILQPRERSKERNPHAERGSFHLHVCGRAGHLDEFCFWWKRIERRHVEYARDSYRDEFIDFPPRSYSHVPPHPYSRALPRTFSRALTQFAHGPNYRSYSFSPRENRFEPRRFGYGSRPHRGDRFSRRPGFPAGWSFTHLEPRHLDDPRFSRRGSHPTRPNGELERIVKSSSGRMLKCWIPKIYLTHPSTEPSTPSRPM
jgi:hypothetical protein